MLHRKRHLRLVSVKLPEVLLVERLDELRDAWLALLFTWFLPQAWFALVRAIDRYEGQRSRTLRGL